MAGGDSVRGHKVAIALLLVTNAQSVCVRGQVQSTSALSSWGNKHRREGKGGLVQVCWRGSWLPEGAVRVGRLGLPLLPIRHLLNRACGW